MASEMAKPGKKLEFFEVEVCETAMEIGFLIGKRFSYLIKNRIASDLILQEQLLPFAQTFQGKSLLDKLCKNNKQSFPRYWDELVGAAEGSGVSVLDLVLLNFRKEILPFVPKSGRAATKEEEEEASNDCSDVLIVNNSMAIAAHNEDGNVALIGHSYLLKVTLPNGLSFTAFTYAGELPSCAFGFNSNGIVRASRTENLIFHSKMQCKKNGLIHLQSNSILRPGNRLSPSHVSLANLVETEKKRR
ncbi:hypothetical protein MA16_Dca014319 [Dendrobium catenatum]|uniref:Uncharacterized protein n=1 Tax=Dendrobium catenatum TaxID=906689 RepID=A0A2I0XFI8_9ASPA|nr:hypothetical protein MA16_Dca014319 [Dendrobium catenatum]